MNEPGRHRIEPIRTDHVRHEFQCGHPFLDEYIRRYARQNDQRRVARAFVAVPEPGTPIAGYYTLASAQIRFDDLPEDASRRLPRYPLPAARLGELAVDEAWQGRGLGGVLLLDALRRVQRTAREVSAWAVVTDPIDARAATFYQHFGFRPLRDQDVLFLTLRELESWLPQ